MVLPTTKAAAKVASQGGGSGKKVTTTPQKNSVEGKGSKSGGGAEDTGPTEFSIDYYRYGKYTKEEGRNPVLGIDTVSVNTGYGPKTLVSSDTNTASIRMFQSESTGKTKDLIPRYTKFILESSAEQHQERNQIIETFGDFYVFFFGETPPIYNYAGMLINSGNINWVQEWQYMYENHLRGTRCANAGARIILTYGFIKVEGFLLSFQTQHNSMNPHGVPIQFSLVLTKRTSLMQSDDFGLKDDIANEGLLKSLIALAGPNGWGTSDTTTSAAWLSTDKMMEGTSNPSIFSPTAPSGFGATA
jgi:hypothetical protein